jgi:cell division protein FtsW (lipid II flippase)
MHAVSRPLELRLLLHLVILVPLGFAVTHIAQTGSLDPGPLGVAVGYVGLMLGAHLALRLLGNQGDQLLLPCVATIGAIGIVMLNRLPQGLLGTDAFGVQFGMATTQLLWFAVGISAMVVVAGRFRDDGVLRHYKYTWALAGTLLLVITFLFGREVNGARLWIFLGPIGFQPGEAIKIVLVIFIAG